MGQCTPVHRDTAGALSESSAHGGWGGGGSDTRVAKKLLIISFNQIITKLRLQWIQSKEKSSKPIPLDLQSRLAILWWTNRDNLRRGVPLGNIDVECYLYSDSSTQGWGAHLQDLTAYGIWSQDQSQLHINILELQAIWLGLRAFSQRVENTRVVLMSDNTSAVAYLRNQGTI